MRGSTRAPLLAVAALVLVLGTAMNPTPPAWAEPPTCQGQPATIVGTAGDDTLVGTPDSDVIAGLAGDDVLTGEGGDDLLCGGRGDDEVRDVVVLSADQALVGGPGDDSLVFSWRVQEDGEEVAVTVLTDFGAGVAVLGDTGVSFPARSFRTVRAGFSEGTWAVVGTSGPDHYVAHQYMSVHARTGAGRDVVHGSWHDDVIRGGPGRDTAYASRGRDTCRSVERGPLGECEFVR